MREIKLRVWDGSKHIALSTALKEEIIGTQYDYLTYEKVNTFNEIETFYENVVLEQYTGLEDKNGKEIYEGDIVAIGEPEVKEKANCNIEFIDGRFCAMVPWLEAEKNDNELKAYCNKTFQNSIEIIGTIHD